MLIALPLAFFGILFLNFYGSENPHERISHWRYSFLAAAIVWGSSLVILSEGLSLFSKISLQWMIGSWSIVILITLLVGIRRHFLKRAFTKLRSLKLPPSTIERLVFLILMTLIGTLAFIAWISPPNNTDSLLYHMPRIAHWIQNSNLRHYPTGYMHQLWTASFAEMTILNFQILWGSDQPANIVQLFSMVSSIIGVTAITEILGANRKTQLLAASLAMSVPTGILQATSTQTDYVASFWLLCTTYFVLLDKERTLHRRGYILLGLAVGLGVLTKGTSYPYALPLMIWFLLTWFRSRTWRKLILLGTGISALVLVLNLGLWSRNFITYQHPLGPTEMLNSLSEFSILPANWVGRVVRQLALNYATPWNQVNQHIIDSVVGIHNLLGVSPEGFKLQWAWNHEDLAGNPLHLGMIVLSVPYLILLKHRWSNPIPPKYALAVAGTFFTFSIVIRFNPFVTRLQLPFILMGSPAVAIAITKSRLRRYIGVVAIGLLFLSLPWVLFNSTRPMIGIRNTPETFTIPCTDTLGCTRSRSILLATEEELLLANWPSWEKPIQSTTELISTSGCQQVGLRLDSHDLEYPFWRLLDAHKEGIRIETIYTFPELERYKDPSFNACAIVCTICTDQSKINGLSRVGTFGQIAVYLKSESSVEENK